MKVVIIFISIEIFLVYSTTVLPSEEIWIGVKSNKAQGLMVYHKNYFIYDERNFTKLDIHGEKMKALNQKQYETYNRNSYLSNYIFIIESIDESEQSLENVANKLSENIKLELDYPNKHNYILAVFAIQNQKVQFYAGTTAIKKITKSDHDKILSGIKNYLRNGEYYKAWTKVIEDYDYYYNNKYYYNGNTNSNTNYKNKTSKEVNPITIIIVILGIAALVIIIVICNKKGLCNSSSSSGYNHYTKSYDRYGYNGNTVSYGRDSDNRVSYDRDNYGRDSDNRVSYDRDSYGGGGNYGDCGSVASGGGGGSYGDCGSVASGGGGGDW